MKEKEQELWISVRNNHRQAFNELYHQTIDMVSNYGKRFNEDHELVKETIQEVYIDLWTKRNRIEIKSSFRFYLLKTFRRALIKSLKEKRKTHTVEFEARLSWVSNKEQQIIAQEESIIKKRKLAEATKSLTPRQQEALFLKFQQGLDSSAIAEIMELQTSAVYKLISTGLIRLRKYF